MQRVLGVVSVCGFVDALGVEGCNNGWSFGGTLEVWRKDRIKDKRSCETGSASAGWTLGARSIGRKKTEVFCCQVFVHASGMYRGLTRPQGGRRWSDSGAFARAAAGCLGPWSTVSQPLRCGWREKGVDHVEDRFLP